MSKQANLKFGERRNATVLFSDMKGFTAFSEKLDPEEIDRLMGAVFSSFERIVASYGGSVEKYIGDALVAVFGVPEIHEDDASRAIHAALEFRAEVERMKSEFTFRTGIHTGLVTTGRRGAYEVVTGHAMTVASRIESSAEAGSILVSETSAIECKNEFEFGESIELVLRGKTERVRALPVLGSRIGLSLYQTPFIGREKWLSAAVKAYMRHDGAAIGGVSLRGPAGIGKTRFVFEFIERLRAIPGWDASVLYSRARKFRTLPFAAVNDLILGYFRISNLESAEKIEAIVTDRLCALASRSAVVDARERQLIESLAQQYAAFVTRADERSEGEQFVTVHRMFEAILTSTSDSPFCPIVIIDNVHLADRQSVDFFEYFAERTKLLPFFVFARRPPTDSAPGLSNIPTIADSLQFFAELTHFELTSFDSVEATALVNSLWPRNDSVDVVSSIVAISGGNPLFIEEYVRYVRDRGIDIQDDEAGLPPTIQTIFLESIESYDTDVQELLRKLSVFERSFVLEDVRVLHERTDGDSGMVEEALDFFIQQGHLIRNANVYLFRHELFKQTLYESILNYNKRILHGVVVDWILEHGEVIVRSNNLRLFYHLARAERIEELRDVVFDDVRHIHNPEYLPYIETVLDRTDEEDPEYFNYLFIKYAVLFNTRCCEGNEEILQTLLKTYIRKKRPDFAARIYQVLCAEFLVAYNFDRSADYGRRAVRYFSLGEHKHDSLQNAYENLASALLFGGRFDENLKVLEMMEHRGKGYDSKTAAFAKRHLQLGEYHDAVSLLESRLLQSDPGETEFWYGGYYMLCFVLLQMHDYPRLGQLCMLLLKAQNQSAYYYADVYAILSITQSYLSRNAGANADEIEREESSTEFDPLKQAEYYLYQIRSDTARLQPLSMIAFAHYAAGDIDGAVHLAEDALRVAVRVGARRLHFTVSVLLAEISYRVDDKETMGFFLAEAEGSYESFPNLNSQDLILYHYLKSISSSVADEVKKKLSLSRQALEAEYNRLGRDDLRTWFLNSRLFGEIYPDRYPLQATGVTGTSEKQQASA